MSMGDEKIKQCNAWLRFQAALAAIHFKEPERAPGQLTVILWTFRPECLACDYADIEVTLGMTEGEIADDAKRMQTLKCRWAESMYNLWLLAIGQERLLGAVENSLAS